MWRSRCRPPAAGKWRPDRPEGRDGRRGRARRRHFVYGDDFFRVTQALPKKMSAVLVLCEHLWEKPMLPAVDWAGGIELSSDWIRPEEVVSVVHRVAPPAAPN